MTVLEFLRANYRQTKKTHYFILEVINRFKEEGRNQLNDLKSKGIVKRLNGANQIIIEYLPEKDTEHD